MVAVLVFSGMAGAQVFTPRRTNDWSENRRDGKCTIRVRVDNQVEVNLRGERIGVKVLAGNPSRDEGSECNAPLPRNGVRNFRFKGIDGRGEVRLLQEPSSSNRWTAVVGIRDPKGGEEGYTFQLTWDHDGSGGWGGSGGSWDDWNNWGGSGGSGGNWGGSGGSWGNEQWMTSSYQSTARRVCENEIRSRTGADRVLFTRTDFFSAGNWRVGLRGDGNAYRGSERRNFSYECSIDPRSSRVERANYNWNGGSGSNWGGSGGSWGGSGGSGGSGGNASNDQLRSSCEAALQDEARRRWGNSSSFRFSGSPRIELAGSDRRLISGNGTLYAQGRSGNVKVECQMYSDGRVNNARIDGGPR
ncbi:MAG: hypothetical protein MUC42_00805 [Bryobacter sp.]|nr:hypothetical protein [Bryobacter sp.]